MIHDPYGPVQAQPSMSPGASAYRQFGRGVMQKPNMGFQQPQPQVVPQMGTTLPGMGTGQTFGGQTALPPAQGGAQGFDSSGAFGGLAAMIQQAQRRRAPMPISTAPPTS